MARDGSTRAIPELPVDGWRSATRCGPNGGNCVEVNLTGVDNAGIVGIRDSKPERGAVLTVGPTEWRTFLRATIRGDI